MRFTESPTQPSVYFYRDGAVFLAIVERCEELGPPYIAFSSRPRLSGCGESPSHALRDLHKHLRLAASDPFAICGEPREQAAILLRAWDRYADPFEVQLVGQPEHVAHPNIFE